MKVTNLKYGDFTSASQTFEVSEIPEILNSNRSQQICSNEPTEPISLISSVENTTFIWSATSSSNVTGYTTNGAANIIPSQFPINISLSPEVIEYSVTPI